MLRASRIRRRVAKILLNAVWGVRRRENHRRRIGWHLVERRWRVGLLGIGGPGLVETFRGLRLVGALDLEPAIAWQMTRAWIIMADGRHRLDRATAIHGRLNMDTFIQAPVAFDNRVRCIDSVDDDGHAGTPRNRDHRTIAFGAGYARRSNQDRQCDQRAHRTKSRLSP